jgi:hypothetical protein
MKPKGQNPVSPAHLPVLSRVVLMAGPALAALACLGGGGSEDPCHAHRTDLEREECRYQHALTLGQDMPRLEAWIDGLPDELTRDLLRIRLVGHDPSTFWQLCEGVRSAGARGQCSRVIDRPHLRAPRP